MFKQNLAAAVEQVRADSPLVHNITNYVVMNFTANVLLASGASPVMAHALEEAADMTAIAGALVINIGTLSPHWVDAMKKAAVRANELGKPYVLDPVGAGATAYRNATLEALLQTANPSVIRGNASEIISLAKSNTGKTKGVDSTDEVDNAKASAELLAGKFSCVVCVSGEVDWITDGKKNHEVAHGSAMMASITGMGCAATALTGAFCAVADSDFEAVCHAMTMMGKCGEIAAASSSGPGSMVPFFLDGLYNFRG